MIAALSGSVNARYRSGNSLCLEIETTGGISYEVLVPASVWESGGEDLSIHHHISEAAQALYGFASREERDTFRSLLSVSGVGPSIAIALMGLGHKEIVRAIVRDDAKALSAVKGVGLQTAKKICLEAKKKFKDAIVEDGDPVDDAIALEVRITLGAMGYNKAEIEQALKIVSVKGIEDADEAIRVAIASLME